MNKKNIIYLLIIALLIGYIIFLYIKSTDTVPKSEIQKVQIQNDSISKANELINNDKLHLKDSILALRNSFDSIEKIKQAYIVKHDTFYFEINLFTDTDIESYFYYLLRDSIILYLKDSARFYSFTEEQIIKLITNNEKLLECQYLYSLTDLQVVDLINEIKHQKSIIGLDSIQNINNNKMLKNDSIIIQNLENNLSNFKKWTIRMAVAAGIGYFIAIVK